MSLVLNRGGGATRYHLLVFLYAGAADAPGIGLVPLPLGGGVVAHTQTWPMAVNERGLRARHRDGYLC